ncbi:UDP-N-acetylmuramate dehydrogenase [Angustibacter sp. McL0619]|uniref:UDP-N-acetylmuramate dehydrogenase n=1 Tax=Angustibacter sp. McL0619 TaxID=3415676 RepID=UPI003CF1F689
MRLAELTTLRVGGVADRLVTASTTDELVDAVREVDDADEPLLLLAGGSNLLVSDEPLPGTVVRVATSGVVVESADGCGGVNVRVAAGERWDDLVARAAAEGWVGIEALSGIPGSVGATPIQNVGAYGQEVSQTIAQVRVWDRYGQQVLTVANADCRFTYRHSAFKGTDRFVVLDVLFQLRLGDLSAPIGYADLARGLGVELGARVPLADARTAVLDQRRKRGMVLDAADHDTWSAGSFFTNPIMSEPAFAELRGRVQSALGAEVEPPAWPGEQGTKTSAAWLIERAGFGKGFGLPGPAALSTKHTLALTNRGGAAADDLVGLARQVRDGVQDAFGVTLVNEPVLVGLTL